MTIPDRPATGAVLRGPFHTRSEAARLAGIPAADLAALPGAVRLDGPMSLEKVYPDFQFARGGGFVPGLTAIVAELAEVLPSRALAAWLLDPRPELGSRSAVDWLTDGRPAAPLSTLVAVAVRRERAA